MITRRRFIFGFLACLAATQCNKIYAFIFLDHGTELRDGWIMMKDDK